MTLEDDIKEQIKSKKVVMYSKTYCPYCNKAKAALQKEDLQDDDCLTIELDKREDGSEIQGILSVITKSRTVPQVFINGKFIGGGTETETMQKNGELKKLLS